MRLVNQLEILVGIGAELAQLFGYPLVSRLVPKDTLSRVITNEIEALQLEHTPRVTGIGTSRPLRVVSGNQDPEILVFVPSGIEGFE